MEILVQLLSSTHVLAVLAAAVIFFIFGRIARSRSIRKLHEEIIRLEKELLRRDAMELEAYKASNSSAKEASN